MGSGCKNTCIRFKKKLFAIEAYKKTAYCSTCVGWIDFSILTDEGKCPCCNRRPRTKSRYLKTKQVKRI